MEVANERCAGLDGHKKVIVACAPLPDAAGRDGRPKPVLARFGTMTEDPVALAGWLAERGVDRAATERTGVYGSQSGTSRRRRAGSRCCWGTRTA